MIFYYALGAGLGHITRSLKVLDKIKIDSDVTILTNSRLNTLPKAIHWFEKHQACFEKQHLPHRLRIIYMYDESGKDVESNFREDSNRQSTQVWLTNQLHNNNPGVLYIDTFPNGISGELTVLPKQFPHLKLIYVARHLKWDVYQPLLNWSIQFDHTYIVETLTPHHQAFVESHSTTFEKLDLTNVKGVQHIPKINATQTQEHVTPANPSRPYCAVIHFGSTEEIQILLEYAFDRIHIEKRNLKLVLVSPDVINSQRYPEIEQISAFPADEVLKQAECIVSAAGFNIIQEQWHSDREHWVVPFQRKYDDQFDRAARYRIHKTSQKPF